MSHGRRAGHRLGTRYRVVVYELDNGDQTIAMDSTGDGFIAATGTATPAGRMTGDIGRGGPHDIQQDLAALIADEPIR
jgi:hypothetical protein